MNSLFEPATREGILRRIETLRPDSPRGWGKMDCSQMLVHCAIGIEAATGDATLSRPLPAKMIGWMFKGWLLNEKPFARNSPTHPMLVLPKAEDFAREQARLAASVRKFCDAGPASAAKYQHAFVGTLTGAEWGLMQFKHLDHHLRQFGAA